eukprot:m.106095 g.106095  ORF g.106095 m.106095 type:complete len:222 (-) comp16889_c0_seq13:1228-1893(-)
MIRYRCDSKFHTEALAMQLAADKTFGFVVMDGSGFLLGSVCGQHRTVLSQTSVSLPKKHSRGGQSARRFARLRLESRHNYVRKVAEEVTRVFITNNTCNVHGLVLAGSADFKHVLNKSDLFDKRLQRVVVDVVDVAYGGTQGFQQAIVLATGALENVRYSQERCILAQYFTEIAKDRYDPSQKIRHPLYALPLQITTGRRLLRSRKMRMHCNSYHFVCVLP